MPFSISASPALYTRLEALSGSALLLTWQMCPINCDNRVRAYTEPFPLFPDIVLQVNQAFDNLSLIFTLDSISLIEDIYIGGEVLVLTNAAGGEPYPLSTFSPLCGCQPTS